MFKENVTIWSNKNFSKRDDLDTIKYELSKNGRNVNVISYKLLKNLEDIKVYKVLYEYADAYKNSKVIVK